MEGGWKLWCECGYESFTGCGVPSKAFGEHIAETEETPMMDANSVFTIQSSSSDYIILDTRTYNEYTQMTLPNSYYCGGGELLYRIHEMIKSLTTIVFIHCAARTRSIIGTHSLLNARLSNPVYCCCNGTMGWQLAKLEVERGATRVCPSPSPSSLLKSQQLALGVMERYGVQKCSWEQLCEWQLQHNEGKRTLFFFDVRLPNEYNEGKFFLSLFFACHSYEIHTNNKNTHRASPRSSVSTWWATSTSNRRICRSMG
jgi:rhodanese-related sulfurtransferase